MSPRIGSLLLVAPLVLVGARCQPDNFPCGAGTADNTGTRLCDVDGEFCVCARNRCARETPLSECASGLRYVFGEEECVAEIDVVTAIDQNRGEGSTLHCPGHGPPLERCGVIREEDGTAATCGDSATAACVCSVNLCVERSGRCETNWRWRETLECVDQEIADSLVGDGPNPFTGLCESSDLAEGCGRPGIADDCPEETLCECATGRCIYRDRDACPGIEYRYVRSLLCLDAPLGAAEVAAHDELCPGYQLPDESADAGESGP